MTRFIFSKSNWIDLLALLLLGVWFYFSVNNWISDSEFWPITLSGHFDQWREHPSLLYKGLFHLSLGWIYAFDLDSAGHLIAAKAFYSALGVFYFFLFYQIAKKHLTQQLSFLVLLMVLTSSIGFSQIGVIRSDFLASFAVMIYLYFFKSEDRWQKQSFCFLLLSFSLVLITPKSIYWVMAFWVHLLLSVKKEDLIKVLKLSFVIITLILGAITLIDQVFLDSKIFQSFYLAARHHYEISQSQEQMNDWWFLKPYLLNDLAVLCLLGGLYLKSFFVKNQKLTNPIILTLLAFIVFMHEPRLPFFVGSFFVVFVLLLVPTLGKIPIRYAMMALLVAISLTLVNSKKQNYFFSNRIQLETVREISNFIESNSFSVIDGLGLFPRVTKLDLTYIGPFDSVANENFLKKIIKTQPDFLVYTGRFLNIEPGISKELAKSYKGVGTGYWLRKDIETDVYFKKVLAGFYFNFRPDPFISR